MEEKSRQSKPGKSVLRDNSQSPDRKTSQLTFSDKVTVKDGAGGQHSYGEMDMRTHEHVRRIYDLVNKEGRPKAKDKRLKGGHQTFYYPETWERHQRLLYEGLYQPDDHDKTQCFLCRVYQTEMDQTKEKWGMGHPALKERFADVATTSKSTTLPLTPKPKAATETKVVVAKPPDMAKGGASKGAEVVDTESSSVKLKGAEESAQRKNPTKEEDVEEANSTSEATLVEDTDSTASTVIANPRFGSPTSTEPPTEEPVLNTGQLGAAAQIHGEVGEMDTKSGLGVNGTRPKTKTTAEDKLNKAEVKKPSLGEMRRYATNYLNKSLNLEKSIIGKEDFCLIEAQNVARYEMMLSRFMKEYNQLQDDDRLDIVLANDLLNKMQDNYNRWQDSSQWLYGCLHKFRHEDDTVSRAADKMAERYYAIGGNIESILADLNAFILTAGEQENLDLEETLDNFGEPRCTSSPNNSELFTTAQETDIATEVEKMEAAEALRKVKAAETLKKMKAAEALRMREAEEALERMTLYPNPEDFTEDEGYGIGTDNDQPKATVPVEGGHMCGCHDKKPPLLRSSGQHLEPPLGPLVGPPSRPQRVSLENRVGGHYRSNPASVPTPVHRVETPLLVTPGSNVTFRRNVTSQVFDSNRYVPEPTGVGAEQSGYYHQLNEADLLARHQKVPKVLDPYGTRLMNQFDMSIQGRILREPSRSQSQIKLQPLSKHSEPEQGIMFWSSFEECYEYTNLQWMQKIVHLHNNVENDLKKTVTAFMMDNDGQFLIGEAKETYYKELYFRIKGVLMKRLDMDKMVYIEDQIAALPSYDIETSLESFYQLDDLLTRIISVAPGDMLSEVSPYLRMIKKKLKLQFFLQLKQYLKMYGMRMSLLSIQEFINETIVNLKDAQKLYPKKKTPRKDHKVNNYATDATEDKKKDKDKKKGSGCPCCKENHEVTSCPKFKGMSKQDKRKITENNKLCFHCLKKFHGYCKEFKKCTQCQRAHNSLLSCPPPRPTEKKEEHATNYHVETSTRASKYCPFTIPCFIVNKSTGEGVSTIAYIDNGSSDTILYKSLAQKIGLEGEETSLTMTTLNKVERKIGIRSKDFMVEALDGSYSAPLNCIAMDYKPKFERKDILKVKKKYKHLKDLYFPQNTATEVGVLLGRDNMHLITPLEVRQGQIGQPWALRFNLGWSLSCPDIEFEDELNCYTMKTEEDVKPEEDEEAKGAEECNPKTCPHSILELLAKVESIGITEKESKYSQAEDRTLKRLVSSIKINDKNEVEIEIPMNDKVELLGNNYEQVKKRQESLEQRLNKHDIYQLYWELIQKSKEQGYIEEIDDPNPEKGQKSYVTHFYVLKESLTTPVRIVFDAKAKVGNTVSYNDCVETAPDLQNLLIDILLNFRKNPIAFSMDVKQMFSQVRIPEHQYDMNRFIFRAPGEEKFRVFCHTRWWFGNTASPTAAQLAVVKMAESKKDELPLGSVTVDQKRYMDDTIDTAATVEQAIKTVDECIKIFDISGMKVQKLISNSKEVVMSVPVDLRLEGYESGDLRDTKVLGYPWKTKPDLISLARPKTQKPEPKTKRGLLHTLASVYDPLGLISPYTVCSRLLMSTLWRKNYSWDEKLPPDIQKDISVWYQQLQNLSDFEVPRQVVPDKMTAIHIFCDSSEPAYGVAGYIVGKNTSGLLMGKGRVHSSKPMSIPRKELQACVLAAKIGATLKRIYPGIPITYWTDSYNCLCWICNDCRRYKQYVGNRVAFIQENSDPHEWRWVPTDQNPADLVSRGVNLPDLIDNDFWKKGPRFLYDDNEEWPEKKALADPTEEVKKDDYKQLFNFHVRAEDIPNLEDFDNLTELKQAMAKSIRIRNGKDDEDEAFTAEELEEAFMELVKIAQEEGYSEELQELRTHQKVPTRSAIFKLCPKLDDNDVLRLKTRLERAESVPYETRFPILLPRKHHITKLIILDVHDKVFHAYGNNYILSVLRERFWIPKGLQTVKKIRRSCVQCQRVHGRPQIPQMAPLPPFRVNETLQVFQEVGVDYTGAFTTVQGRGKTRLKRYGCIFTCMVTRAVHIEISASMDTSDFIDCLIRFVARRGRPSNLYSDNGTNFVGASGEMRQLVGSLDQNTIQEFTARNGFNFIFNPPWSPHFGGAWESMVKSLKKAIYAILTDREFTDWELLTAMCQAEDIVNSRPLTFVNADPNDFSVITPSMFITGRMNNQIFPDVIDEQGFNIRDPKTRWRYIQRAIRDLWRRWIKEILPTLGQRSKWIKDGREYQVDDEVLIMDKNVPRYKWQPGRIVEVFPGRDGRIRVVKINTENGTLESNVHRLIPLT